LPNPIFTLTFRQCCREVPARGRHGGLGFTPASSILTSKCDACAFLAQQEKPNVDKSSFCLEEFLDFHFVQAMKFNIFALRMS
jgi:hypothetical protein